MNDEIITCLQFMHYVKMKVICLMFEDLNFLCM